jgi:predicted phosphohydrolase
MKIHEISDLHMEGTAYDLYNMPEADVLILAGDILCVNRLGETSYTLGRMIEKYKHVLVIYGNHEFYGTSFKEAKSRYQTFFSSYYPQVHLLDNSFITLDGVLFAGTTLWTNFKGGDVEVIDAAKRYINDFHVIEGFTIEDATKEFNKAIRFIKKAAKMPHEKKVMITHFTPSYKSIHPRWGIDPCNFYFSNNLNEDLIKPFNLWYHGHTHDSFDYMIGATRVICNPKGYGRENAMNFKNQMVVEI